MFYARSGAGKIHGRVGGNLTFVFRRERKMSMPSLVATVDVDVEESKIGMLEADGEQRGIVGSPGRFDESPLPPVPSSEEEDESGDLGGGMIDEGEDEEAGEGDLASRLVDDEEEEEEKDEEQEEEEEEEEEQDEEKEDEQDDGSSTPRIEDMPVENPW
jgi:hypothetical protein